MKCAKCGHPLRFHKKNAKGRWICGHRNKDCTA